jgi:hypothetical protein
MNALYSLKQVQMRGMLEAELPEWPEILERQAALETPVWVNEWLDAGHIQMAQQMPETPLETWLDMAARQQPIETLTWQTEWLDWIDSSPVLPVLSKDAAKRPTLHRVHPFNRAKNPAPMVPSRASAAPLRRQRAASALEIAA